MAKQYGKLSDFLQSMQDKPKMRDDFKKDPATIVKNSGLSPKHKKLVLSGNASAIGHAVVDEHLEQQAPGKPIQPLSMSLCCWIIGSSNP